MIIIMSMIVIVLFVVLRLAAFLDECVAAHIPGWAESVDGVPELDTIIATVGFIDTRTNCFIFDLPAILWERRKRLKAPTGMLPSTDGTRFRWREIIKFVVGEDMIAWAMELRLTYSARMNCSRLPETHPPPCPSNSPGKPTSSVFSALMFYPCRQCRTLCRSGWIVCIGSKAAVSIWCPHILCMWHWLIGQYRPTSPSGWRDHPVDHSAMSRRAATRICSCHHRGP